MSIDLRKIQTAAKTEKKQSASTIISGVTNLLSKDIKLWSGGLKDKKKEAFYSELYILLTSGIDIRTSLDIIVEEQKAEDDKKLFSQIKADVIGGLSLSNAMNKTGKFSTYEYYSLLIGEESGRIKDVLTDLTIYFSKKIKQRRQLTSALTYPIMVIITAIFAVGFMLNFIVPMFMDVFKRFNGQMPALTRSVVAVSVFLKSYTLLMVVILAAIVVTILSIRKKEYFRMERIVTTIAASITTI